MRFLVCLGEGLLALTPLALLGAGLFFGFRLGWFFLRHPLRVLRGLFGRRSFGGENTPAADLAKRQNPPPVCRERTKNTLLFSFGNSSAFSSMGAKQQGDRAGGTPSGKKGDRHARAGDVSLAAAPAAPSPFRAASMAMAGTIGVGNMTGVALALLAGGAGAVFWMWVAALGAMVLKYAEITLAMDARTVAPDGSIRGGTPHAMRAGGFSGVAALFAALCLINTLVLGGAVQANAVGEAFLENFGIPPLLTGLFLVLLALPAVLGKTEGISRITSRLVPIMCFLYIGASAAILIARASLIPSVFARIFAGAFTPQAAGGGFLGFFSSRALRVGVARGLVSNEGGCGTAPLAHVTSGEKIPARQGLWGIFEVFADTVLICTLTAAVILLLYPELPATPTGGMALTRGAFVLAFGEGGGAFVTLSLFLFAYATVLCEIFYGRACLLFFTESRPVCRVYLFFFCLSLLIGSLMSGGAVWALTDIILAVMTWLNLAWLLKNAKRITTLTRAAGLLE